jgi:hypothetical protein
MGNNSVFFGLNDYAGDYARSPKTFGYILEHAYTLCRDENRAWSEVNTMANYYGEPLISQQALRAIDCFHSNERRYYQAGGNIMTHLEVLRTGKTKDGRKTVTLLLE